MTPDPTPACEQDAATIDDLHERIDRLEERDDWKQRAIDAEAKVARVERIVKAAEWYQARVVDLRDLRAALSVANPTDVSAPHPDAPDASGGHTEGVTGR